MFNIGDRVWLKTSHQLVGVVVSRIVFASAVLSGADTSTYNVRFDDIPFVTNNINEWMLEPEDILVR